jgi:hypothetical protein
MVDEYIRKEFLGGAPARTLASSITNVATSLTLSSGTSWPTGTPAKFVAVIDRGTANEEKVLITARSGTSCTGVQRGYDGTTAAAHNAGATIEHCVDGYTLNQLSAMANAPTSQYDLVMRGATANAWSRIGVGSNGQALVVSGGVPVFGQLPVAGLADGAVTTAKLADEAVTTAKIDDDAVTAAKIAANTITTAEVDAGFPRGIIDVNYAVSNGTPITAYTAQIAIVDVPLVNGRAYLLTGQMLVASTVAGDIANVWLRNTTTSTNLAVAGTPALYTTHGIGISVAYPFVAGATGDVDFEIGLERAAGTGNVFLAAGSTHRSFIMIEDKGQL